MRLILASKSPARLATLVAAGVTPIVRVSTVDEPAVLAGLRERAETEPSPAEQVVALASAKCGAVVNVLVGGGDDIIASDEELLVVGCDSMLELDGRMLGKPRTPDVARERIREMRGREGVLWTGHTATLLSTCNDSGVGRAVLGSTSAGASTIVRFGSISDAEIEAYIESGEPLHVAGSFTIDGLGGPFIAGVDGDHHSVVGFSLPLVHDMAAELGVFWPDLWDHRRAAD